MNLQNAANEHADWNRRFRTAISRQEQLDVLTISRDNCCSVGQWLHGAGRIEWGTRAEFRAALERHRTFHTVAAEVAQLINARKFSEAELALGHGTSYASALGAARLALINLRHSLIGQTERTAPATLF